MKRVHPDSKNPCIANSLRDIFSDVPGDIVALVLGRLRFSDAVAVSSASKHFSLSIPMNDNLWARLFRNHFSNLPRLAPHLNWLGECQTQRQCTRNLAAGVHTFHRIPIGQIDRGQNVNTPEDADLHLGFEIEAMKHRYVQNPDHTFTIVTDKPKACSFVLDEAGNILIGYENGSVAILNPKTGEYELLLVGKTSLKSSDAIASLICKNGMYIAATQITIIVWDANTRGIINTYSYGDAFSSFKHVKFIDEKLLISDGEAKVFIVDPRAGKILNILELWGNPTDISLCGQTFIASVGDRTVFVDLKSNVQNYRTLTYPFRICGQTESSCLKFNEMKGTFFYYSISDESHLPIHLWTVEEGIPGGFIGRCGERGAPLCSWDQLSQLFNQVVAQQFDYWGSKGRNQITNALPLNVSKDIPCAFHSGKIFYFSADKETILCMDFAASPQTILQQLAQMLGDTNENSNVTFNYANKILERFPYSVWHEINKNYSEASFQPQQAEPPKNLNLEQLGELIKIHQSQKQASDAERLRQAILQYTETT